MPINKNETSKFIPIKMPKGLDDSEKEDLKASIGEFVISEMLRYVADGTSPVSGGRAFKKLTKKYAEKEKGGDTTANLDLHGDMLGSLTFEPSSKGIKVGIFDSDQAIKSYNHNVGDTLPKRQFIPNADEDFKKDIMKGIDSIIKDYVDGKN